MTNVALDATSCEDLLLSEPGLFVGFPFDNINVSFGLDNSTTSSIKSFVLYE
jgi:hypothetical protein